VKVITTSPALENNLKSLPLSRQHLASPEMFFLPRRSHERPGNGPWLILEKTEINTIFEHLLRGEEDVIRETEIAESPAGKRF
jgi:hypothetical protein